MHGAKITISSYVCYLTLALIKIRST